MQFQSSTVTVPPTITSQPVRRANTVGKTAPFTVAASGTALLSYQWRFNGANMEGAINISWQSNAG